MIIQPHTPRDFAVAIQALLPPGAAWDWPAGGFGDGLLMATAAELARIDGAVQPILDRAVDVHRPAAGDWTLAAYRAVAQAAVAGVVETLPRRPFAVGSHVGERLWSHTAPEADFPVDLVRVDHLIGPCRVGSRIGDRLWGPRSRYFLRVRYYRSVVDPAPLYAALAGFAQAHVYLWFEDITGVGGIHASH